MQNASKKILYYFVLSFCTAIAIFIRFLGRDFLTSDFVNCLSVWYSELVNAGPGISSLTSYSGDYSLPYIYIIWLLGKLPFPFLYSLKTVNGVFDFLLAVFVGKIVHHYTPQSRYGFGLGYCITLLIPNVFLNSCYWGQCDALYTSLLLITFWCLLKERYSLMMIFLGITISFKLQAIFILPFILIVYWLTEKFSVLHFLIVPVTMLFMNIPVIIAGYPPSVAFSQLLGQTDTYPYLYYFYPNLWFFFQARPFYLFRSGAVLLAITALLLFIVLLIKHKIKLTHENMLPILLWTSYTCVFFLPAMHERYGFFPEILAIILCLIHARTAWLAVTMLLCTFPKYLYALDLMGNSNTLQMLEAAGNTFAYIAFTCLLWHGLFQKGGNRYHVQV